MSSHHIVRDQQEPALIVEDISEFPIKTLNEMLGWSPTVVCLENSIEQFTMYGLKIDHAIVERRNLHNFEEMLSHQYPFVLHKKEANPLAQAIQILKQSAHTAINIVTTEFKIEQVIKELLLVKDIEFSISTAKGKTLLTTKKEYHKWLPKGVEIEISSLNKQALFNGSGFTSEMTNRKINKNELLKASEDGKVIVQCSAPPFLVLEAF